ncbi:MAG: hypothetical protein RIS47_466 [Bacteroidota bacterium]
MAVLGGNVGYIICKSVFVASAFSFLKKKYDFCVREIRCNRMKKKKTDLIPEDMPRKNAQSFLLNDKELAALEMYCKKYKIQNRSKFIRETLFSHVLQRFDEDYPTLFTAEEMKGLRANEE